MDYSPKRTCKVFLNVALLLLLAGVAGCQSASVDDLAPTIVTANPDATYPEKPINTGEYPKFGHIPVAETAQLGPAGSAAMRGNLVAARASQNIGAPGPETYAQKMLRLQKLGQLHGKETLAEIEAK